MHDLEPYYNWRQYYISSEDEQSPYFGKEYNEFEYTEKIYNYYIHPQWDGIDSPTLFLKVLYTDYERGFCIIEFIGEWNDAISNDIMNLKEYLIDGLIHQNVNKFIFLMENVLNFHGDGDDYYQEISEDLTDEGGWMIVMNAREHIIEEMWDHGLHYHIYLGERYQNIAWRRHLPEELLSLCEERIFQLISQYSKQQNGIK